MSDLTGDHEVTTTPSKNPILSDRAYTILEFVARVVLPGLATLYLAVAGLWGVENGPQVVGTIVAVDTFLGLFLGLAQRSYDNSVAKYNGSIDISDTPGAPSVFTLNLDTHPDDLANMSQVTFKVNPVTNS